MTTFDPFVAAKMMVSGFLMLAVCAVELLGELLIYVINFIRRNKLVILGTLAVIVGIASFVPMMVLISFLIV